MAIGYLIHNFAQQYERLSTLFNKREYFVHYTPHFVQDSYNTFVSLIVNDYICIREQQNTNHIKLKRTRQDKT